MNAQGSISIFCDFDGTAAMEDVGNAVFHRFAPDKAPQIIAEIARGEIGGLECLQRECAAVDSCTPEELDAFVAEFELDPYFKQFVAFCEDRSMPIVILSDGLEYYAKKILERNNLDHLPLFSNPVEFVQRDGKTKLVPSFPHSDADCKDCGNCKRNHVLNLAGDEDVRIYIGNGVSDQCPAKYCDVVFAKSSLREYCRRESIRHYEFRNFNDVIQKLEHLLQQPRIKRNRRAQIARHDVFICE
jgi:2,3-diketo-5-methylthio-1-phosphopentane phosphatase